MKRMTLAVASLFVAASVNAAEVRVSDPGLKSYTITDEIAINHSLTGKSGDPEMGRKIAIDRKRGNCLACHAMPIPEQQFHGETGPSLHGVANNLSEGELRMLLVDSKVVNEDTMMPAFYKVFGFNRTADKFVGKPILSAQEVEDVVAYLRTLNKDQ